MPVFRITEANASFGVRQFNILRGLSLSSRCTRLISLVEMVEKSVPFRWCFLTLKPGTEPLKALVETFLDTWQFDAGDP